jgi:hypothetical protein
MVHISINRDGTQHTVEASNALEIKKGFEVYKVEGIESDKERVRCEIKVSQEEEVVRERATSEPHGAWGSKQILLIKFP